MTPASTTIDNADASIQVERIFCGFDQPFLHVVAKDLISRYATDTLIDLSKATVIVSGTRVGRRLMELLVIEGDSSGNGRGIVPPKVITRGGLLDSFMPTYSNMATEVARHLAWVVAIKSASPELLSKLSIEQADEYVDRSASALAQRIDTLYSQLNGEALQFADVAKRGQEVEGFYEEQRWEALAELHELYLQELASVELQCRYQCRTDYLQTEGNLVDIGDIFLCGLLECNRQQRKFLHQCNGSIHAYVFGDSKDEPGFDALGAIAPNYWETKRIPLTEEQIEVVQHPRDIAPAAASWLSEPSLQVHTEESVVGLGNETLGPFIKAGLERLGIPSREAAGKSPLHTDLGFTLTALLSYLESRSLEDLSSLVRTPLIQAYLCRTLEMDASERQSFLDEIDRYQSEHLQDSTRGSLPRDLGKHSRALDIISSVNELLSPLTKSEAPISSWASRLYDFLGQILVEIPSGTNEIIDTVNAIFSEYSDCPLSHQLKGSEVISMFIDQLVDRLEIADTTSGAIELLGWLEVAFDDSCSVVLTGIEEEFVPAVINADPFIPDALARHLGLANNASRYCRDAALLSAIVRSKRRLRIIACRRTLSGEIAEPSRLLFACEIAELSSRINRLRGHGVRYFRHREAQNERECFMVGPPESPQKHIDRMSATSFGAYLRCPYEFYLNRIARVEPVVDKIVELDGLGFGNLAHDVLSWAAKHEAFNDPSEKIIRDLLCTGLQDLSRDYYGANPLPAVAIQIEQLRRRFERLAIWQSEHRRQGWLTVEEERAVSDELVSLPLVEGSMVVTGRIDRVDRLTDTDRYLIIDYKTSEQPREKSNVCAVQGNKDDENRYTAWRDFQPPLYVRAASAIYPNASAIEFGFLNISPDLAGEVYTPISIDPAEMKDAIEQATEIAQRVSDGIFWPPSGLNLRYSDENLYWRLLASVTGDTTEEVDDA